MVEKVDGVLVDGIATENLFGLRRGVILYDMTNTHFEGLCAGNPKARHGKNKQKRNDCRQMAVGMAFDERGLPLAHEVFEGNITESKTLALMLDRLLLPQEGGKPVVILDAGFASAANLALLKERGLGYLVNITRGHRSRHAGEFAAGGFEPVPGREPDQRVEVKTINDPDNPGGHLVLCRSAQRREKELAMLRTDRDLEPAQIWSLYMTLLQAEEGFACLKGALGLRPNFHQTEHRVEAHIFISVLAYHLLCWVRERLRLSSDTRDWKTRRRRVRPGNERKHELHVREDLLLVGEPGIGQCAMTEIRGRTLRAIHHQQARQTITPTQISIEIGMGPQLLEMNARLLRGITEGLQHIRRSASEPAEPGVILELATDHRQLQVCQRQHQGYPGIGLRHRQRLVLAGTTRLHCGK